MNWSLDIQPIGVSEEIILEPLGVHHAAPLYKLIDENREHLSRFLTWVDKMQSPDQMMDHIKASALLQLQRQDFSFVIIYNGEVAGRIGLHHVVMQHRLAAIGYWIAEKFQGRGVMTKSCRALVNFGFGFLDLNRIEIKAVVANQRSKAIPVSLGFAREATLHEAELLNGKFEDLELFAILRKDWANSGRFNTAV